MPAAPHRIAWVLPLLAVAAAADDALQGRWEGTIEVPGAEQALVLDLIRDPKGEWSGYAILPGRGVSGAELHGLRVTEREVFFSLEAAMPFPSENPPELSLGLDSEERLQGRFRMAGLEAPAVLERSGDARPASRPRSTPVAAALAGHWSGTYAIFGQPRQVSLKLDGTQATMRIVGRRTTDVPFALVQQRGDFLALSGNEFDIAYEGRWDAAGASIEGTFMQGPLELPLSLVRDAED